MHGAAKQGSQCTELSHKAVNVGEIIWLDKAFGRYVYISYIHETGYNDIDPSCCCWMVTFLGAFH